MAEYAKNAYASLIYTSIAYVPTNFNISNNCLHPLPENTNSICIQPPNIIFLTLEPVGRYSWEKHQAF